MTILKGSEKIVASLNQFGVVRRVRRGHYVIAEPIELNDELTRFLVFADMLVNRSVTGRSWNCRTWPSCFRSRAV